MCEKYNGWSNRETWLVKLWIDNEQHTYQRAQEMARYWVTHREGIGSSRVALFADALEDWISDADAPTMYDASGEYLPASVYSDLLDTALARVDWYEIAKAYLDDVREG